MNQLQSCQGKGLLSMGFGLSQQPANSLTHAWGHIGHMIATGLSTNAALRLSFGYCPRPVQYMLGGIVRALYNIYIYIMQLLNPILALNPKRCTSNPTPQTQNYTSNPKPWSPKLQPRGSKHPNNEALG